MNVRDLPSYPGPLVLRNGPNLRMVLTTLGCLLFAVLCAWMCADA